MNTLLIEINTFIPPAVPISLAFIGALAKAENFGVKIIEGTPEEVMEDKTVREAYIGSEEV